MSISTTSAKLGFVDTEVTERLLKGLDFAALFVVTLIVSLLLTAVQPGLDQSPTIAAFSVFMAFLGLLALRMGKLYAPKQLATVSEAVIRTMATLLVCGVGSYLVASWLVLDLPTNWIPGWSLAVAVYVIGSRLVVASWIAPLAKAGRFRRRIAIVGGGSAAEDALRTLEQSPDLDIEVVGMFDDRYDPRSPQVIGKAYKIGKIADLAEYARSNRVDLIIVAIPLSAEARLLSILKRLWELPVDIRISGKASSLKFSPMAYAYLGNLPLLALFDRPLAGWGLFVKNAVERVLAFFGIIAFAPLMLAIAAAIRFESKGPIIFKQKRYGFNNELIEVYKFRSMYTDRSDANAVKLVTKDDPRVTKVGKFIRKASIDELPQLFNVLTGQLSLVGPRPHATQAKAADALYESVVDGYFARHKVRPGITGWAQINGWRGETDTREKIEQRVKFDLEYIDQWSLWFDIKIIAKTPLALLKGENAY